MEDQNQGPQISDYFTAEVEAAVSGMTDQEMISQMQKLEGTPMWWALLRYVRLRTSSVQGVLFMTDPVVKPTEIARAQGIMIGLGDFQEAVISDKLLREEAEREAAASPEEE